MKKPQRVAPGIRIREHDMRKHGIRFDRYFSVYFKINGKMVEQYLGWASEGWTLEKAQSTLNELKQNYKTATGPVTLGEKRKVADAMKQAEEREKIQTEAENVTFKTFFENEYLPTQKTHKGRDTWIKEEQHGVNWIFPIIGDIPIKDVSSFHIERIKKNLLDAGRTPRTIQYCFATIRQTWNHARRAGIVTEDSPTRAVKIPKFDNQRQRFLTDDECSRLLDELKKHSETTYRMALLSLDAGLRFSEVSRLQFQDIDLIRQTILLRDTKSNRNRTVYMTERIKGILSGMPKAGPDSLVFPDRNGNQIKHVSKTFDEVVASLGLNQGISDDRLKCVFHSLRHTHCSRLLESGADIFQVSKMIGHTNVQTTMRYAHIRADRMRDAIKNMEKKSADVIQLRKKETA